LQTDTPRKRQVKEAIYSDFRRSGVWARYRSTWHTPAGPRKGLQVTVNRGDTRRPLVARWGGVSLARKTTRVVLKDDLPAIWRRRPAEVVGRLLAGRCELCKAHTDVEAHHVRRLKDLQSGDGAEQPEWARMMAARRRKSLIVCISCHHDIHDGITVGQ
jgi:AI2M/AI1M-like, HNH endonuclease